MKNKILRMMMGVAAAGVVFTYICVGYCQQGEEKLAIKTEASVEAVDALVASSVGAVLQSKPEKKEKVQVIQKEEPEVVTIETVSGEVSGITKDYVAIVYNKDYDAGHEYEILIPIKKATVLKHAKSFSDIKPGDLISVEYKRPQKGESEAMTVSFIQSGVDSLVAE